MFSYKRLKVCFQPDHYFRNADLTIDINPAMFRVAHRHHRKESDIQEWDNTITEYHLDAA